MAPKNLNNTYYSPPSTHSTKIIVCGIIMALVALPTPSILLPPFSASSPVPANAAKALRWTQNGLFYLLYVAHTLETMVFTQRLQKHGVRAGSGAWWKWMGTCFVGGKFCFDYFDRLVAKE